VPVLAWARRTWVPTLVVLVLIYGAFFHYLVLGLPGVGYGSHMELVPVGWRRLGEQMADVEEAVRQRTGAEPLVMGMDRYETGSELTFYAPDRARSVQQTTSDVVFGGMGLMYKRWFPLESVQGRNLLLVGFKAEDLDSPQVHAHTERLEPMQEAWLAKDGQMIRRYYYRLAYNYH